MGLAIFALLMGVFYGIEHWTEVDLEAETDELNRELDYLAEQAEKKDRG
jgi:hypothetical protein